MTETDRSTRRMLAHNLRAARRARKMTQIDLSEAANVSQQFISQVERGHVSVTVDTLSKFAKALRIPIDTLLQNPDA